MQHLVRLNRHDKYVIFEILPDTRSTWSRSWRTTLLIDSLDPRKAVTGLPITSIETHIANSEGKLTLIYSASEVTLDYIHKNYHELLI